MRLNRTAATLMLSLLAASACDDSGGGTTNTTTTSSSTSIGGTGSTMPNTTTTLAGGGHLGCTVTWRLTNAVTLGALQFETDYAAAPGELSGRYGQVVCSDLTGSLASFNDDEDRSTLIAGLVSLSGIHGPRSIIRCEFLGDLESTDAALPEHFAVTVIDSADPDLNPVVANVAVSSIQCFPGVTSTTYSDATTTTTLGEPFTIGFQLLDRVTASALQISVDYSQAHGQFSDRASLVDCTSPLGGLYSFYDHDAESSLSAGFISLTGITGPAILAECDFTTGDGTPDPGDFSVSVVDVTDLELNPIVPNPAIGVTVAAR